VKTKLPKWVVDNRTAVLEEARPYRDLTIERRSEILSLICRGAMRMLEGREDRARLLAWTDPLPSSTRAHLDRLQADWKARWRSPPSKAT